MCGISGFILKPGELVDINLLKEMTTTMSHRGPDSQGEFVHQNIGLGHRRLKIIDLSDSANQPLFSQNKKIGIVFNGEIYNFLQLRNELQNFGMKFETKSDTEVILCAFEYWGEESFKKLNGIFSFAIWDNRNNKNLVYLVRDRVGTKPLFYSYINQRLGFSSELKPLMKLPWISKNVSPQTLFHFLKFSHVPSPSSILDDVKQVVPGSFLILANGQLTSKSFWNPLELYNPDLQLSNKNISEDQWVSELDQTLKEVMSRQIISDVPVGCFLSGGIDSSLLTMQYSSLQSNPIKTFSIGYKEAKYNETSYAKTAASVFKTDHHEFIVTAKDMFSLIPDLPNYFDQPLADPTSLPTLLLSKFAKEHVSVVFSGDGGDELFFGYSYEPALLKMRFLLSLPPQLREAGCQLIECLLYPFNGQKIQQTRKLLEILQFKNEAELFQYFIGTIGPMRLDRLSKLIQEPIRLSPSCYQGLMSNLNNLPWNEKISQVFQQTFMIDTVLAKTDRATMAFGLEGRVPFLDNKMLEFAAGLPFHMKYNNGNKKYILKKLLATKMSTEFINRPKQGFSIPLEHWLREDLKFLLDDYLNTERIKKDGSLVPEEVQNLVKQHLSKRANHSHLLWSLITYQMWKEKYF
jgi:asparagine synthase (glutamine-hydrolysing)